MTDTDIIYLINQFFEIESKCASRKVDFLARNFTRLNDKFDDLGFTIMNPLGEKYKETRTDVDAHISSEKIADLKIIEVLKPIIYKNVGSGIELVQKGNVIVG